MHGAYHFDHFATLNSKMFKMLDIELHFKCFVKIRFLNQTHPLIAITPSLNLIH